MKRHNQARHTDLKQPCPTRRDLWKLQSWQEQQASLASRLWPFPTWPPPDPWRQAAGRQERETTVTPLPAAGKAGVPRAPPYFELPSGFVHLLVTQVHHEGGQSILSLLPHVSISVLQASVQLRNTQHQVPWRCPQRGQLLRQPAQHLEGDGESSGEVDHLRKRAEKVTGTSAFTSCRRKGFSLFSSSARSSPSSQSFIPLCCTQTCSVAMAAALMLA